MHFVVATLILAANPAAPTADGTVVYRCNFDPSHDRDYDGWPDGWTRRRGRDYPLYQRIQLTTDAGLHNPTNPFLRVQLDGGAVAVFTPPLEIVAETTYLLEAMVRPLGLQFDVVSLSLTFLDSQHQPLETVRAPVLTSSRDWQLVRIGPVRAPPAPAHYASIGLHVEPAQLADLSGTVDLDDLRLVRSPQLELSTDQAGNLFTHPRDVTIYGDVGCSTVTGPRMEWILTDAYGQEVERVELPVPTGEETATSRVSNAERRVEWNPSVPGWGFYRVEARLTVDPETTINQTLQFAVLPPLEAPANAEFGWSLPQALPELPASELVDILEHTGIHWLKWPILPARLSQDERLAEQLNRFAEQLQNRGIRLVGVLDTPPQESNQGSNQAPADVSLTLIAGWFLDAHQWKPALDTVLTPLSQRIRWWQLGADHDTSLADLPGLETTLREVRQHFRSFGGDLAIGLAWPANRPSAPTAIVPWDFMAWGDLPKLETLTDTVPRTSEAWYRWYTLELPPRAGNSLVERIRTLVFQMVAAKIMGAHVAFATDPCRGDGGLIRADGQPEELFLPWRTTCFLLGDAQFIGSLPLATGSANFVFRRGHDVVMVMWNDRPTREIMNLGAKVQHVDVWGRPLPSPEPANEYPVGPEPSFLVGLDPDLVAWSRNCVLRSTQLESMVGREQVIHLDFRNSYLRPVRGVLRIQAPPHWSLSPRETTFFLQPGELRSLPLTLSLGSDTPGGRQSLRLDFQLEGTPEIHFALFHALEIGLRDLSVTAKTCLDQDDNLVVEVLLTNHRDVPHSYRCTLFVTDRPRVRRDQWQLAPGDTTLTFVLPQGKDLLGQTLWLRTEELEGASLLNHALIATP